MMSKQRLRAGGRALASAIIILSAGRVPLAAAKAKATIVTFDPQGPSRTEPRSINKGGSIVGEFVDGTDTTRGFLRTPDGTITEITEIGQTVLDAVGINDNGQITGAWADGNFFFHCFEREPDGNSNSCDV